MPSPSPHRFHALHGHIAQSGHKKVDRGFSFIRVYRIAKIMIQHIYVPIFPDRFDHMSDRPVHSGFSSAKFFAAFCSIKDNQQGMDSELGKERSDMTYADTGKEGTVNKD